MKKFVKDRVQCKCGLWFMTRKSLGHHIKAQKKRIDISGEHSAKRSETNERAESKET